MKAKLFFLFAFICTIFSSCDLTGSSNYTPEISLWASHIHRTDTIGLFLTDQGGVLRTDTINVGDTIVLKMALNGLTNNLTELYISASDTSVSKILLPVTASLDTIFSKSGSNYSTRHFVFLPKQNFVYFPIRYIAAKPTLNAYIQLTLASDAEFKSSSGNNSVSIKIKIPAVDVK
jgi:hypothetical protein